MDATGWFEGCVTLRGMSPRAPSWLKSWRPAVGAGRARACPLRHRGRSAVRGRYDEPPTAQVNSYGGGG